MRRSGRKYAAGGRLVSIGGITATGTGIARNEQVKTAGFPAGKYRYYVEYRRMSGAIATV